MNIFGQTIFFVLFLQNVVDGMKLRKRLVRRVTTQECQEPEDLKTQLIEWHRESTQIEIEPSLAEQTDDWQPPNEEPDVCDQNPATDPASTVMQRSLCPWRWKSSYDEHREPKTLTEAFCLCRKSRGGLGAYCMPIRRQVAILRRSACDPQTMTYTYEKSVQWITVGCHSVLPRSQRALPIFSHYQRNDLIAS